MVERNIHWYITACQVSGESLVRVGDSNESSADGYRPREAPGLAEHAGTYFITG